MTLGEFRRITKDLPDETLVAIHDHWDAWLLNVRRVYDEHVTRGRVILRGYLRDKLSYKYHDRPAPQATVHKFPRP